MNNNFLQHILSDVQRPNGFNQSIDPNRYTGQIIYPDQTQGYYINQFDPNQAMGTLENLRRLNIPRQGEI